MSHIFENANKNIVINGRNDFWELGSFNRKVVFWDDFKFFLLI